MTCAECKNRKKCIKICDAIEKLLPKDSRQDVDRLVYESGILRTEHVKKTIHFAAMLSPIQVRIMRLYCRGFSQIEIATATGIAQGLISRKLRGIRQIIKNSYMVIQ